VQGVAGSTKSVPSHQSGENTTDRTLTSVG